MAQPFQKTVLLSDDVNRALGTIDCFIHRSAFQTRVARTGEEIVEMTRRFSPDAILTNYYLGGIKGDEVCRILKKNSGDPSPPILIVGPGDQADIAERCLRAGCDDFIASPASPNILLQRLAAQLGVQFRLHARLQAVMSVSFGRVISEFLGYSKDISEGGILLETTLAIDRGRRLHLRIFLEEDNQPVIAKATVLRVDRAQDEQDHFLLGMQFQDLDPQGAGRLREFIQSRAAKGH